jgi:hypothetical protein
MQLFVASDNLVTLGPVTDVRTGNLVTTATATFTLRTLDGVQVTTGTLTHVSGGVYQGVLTATLTANTTYYLHVACINSGSTLTKRIPCVAVYDGEDG